MSEPFLKANDRPLTLEAAKLHAVLVEVDRFVAEVRSLPDAIRGDLDRQEAAIAALHALLGEMKEHNAETGEQYSLLLQSARSVVHTIAEEALADSITKKIVSDIYAELTPQLKEEVNKESERNSAASAALAKELMSAATGAIRENAAVIADAVAGKPPLPPVPPEDAEFMEKAKGQTIRCLAKAKRFMVSANLALVWFTCCIVVNAAAHVLKLSSSQCPVSFAEPAHLPQHLRAPLLANPVRTLHAHLASNR
jgi:hypothetical protein